MFLRDNKNRQLRNDGKQITTAFSKQYHDIIVFTKLTNRKYGTLRTTMIRELSESIYTTFKDHRISERVHRAKISFEYNHSIRSIFSCFKFSTLEIYRI